MTTLLKLDQAAAELGVPEGSLRRAAEQHGYIVRMGRAVRIDPNDLPELVKRCQDTPKAHASSTATAARPASTLSATDPDSSRRALEIAEKLKRHSQDTSKKGIDRLQGRVIQLK